MKKGYKVTDVNRVKKIGVAAENLEELIEKSRKKLGVKASAEWRVCVAQDGTQVGDDDYLATLPPQTLLVLLTDEEEMVTDFDYYYNLIRSTKKEYFETGYAAKEFLNKDFQEKYKVFQRYIAATDDARVMLSERAQDPAWFEGLEPSEKTKEQAMSKRVKERMRGYYYKTKSALQSSDLYINSRKSRAKELINQFLSDLRKILESNKYNETYFNRNAEEKIRMCLKSGLFECGGLWNSPNCTYEGDHIINPYRSREERIIFQTWNLDHKIELSRSIIPKILQAVSDILNGDVTCNICSSEVKKAYIFTDPYYLQIFTRDNLKLVHIVCHHKGKHDADTDIYSICIKCSGTKSNMGNDCGKFIKSN